VTNPVAGTVTILNASVDPPAVLATINLTTGANAQCSGCTPLSVAVLPDGTRAYVASLQLSGTTAAPVVTVINALSNTVKKTITLAGVPAIATCAATRFRLSIAAAGDSTRVYVGNCDGENVTIIRTSDDSLVFNLPAPVSAASPPPGSTQPPPQNPVFVFAGP
jgi:DNA-binding beta-propeller fold protein YncE